MNTSTAVPARPARLLLVGLLAVMVGACAAPAATGGLAGSPSARPSAPVPTGAPSLSPTPVPATTPSPVPVALLTVTSEGGFINPLTSLAALPAVVVESDGRVFTPGPADTLAPSVLVRDFGAAGAAAIAAALKDAGLDTEQSGGGPAPDTGATVFTVTLDGVTSVSRFTGGGPVGRPGGAPSAAPGASPDARAAAMDLLAKLADPAVGWGGAAEAPTAYAPTGYKVYAAPVAGGASDAPVAAWPLAAGLATFGSPAVPDFGMTGLRSGVVLGPDAAALAKDFAGAGQGTLFTSGGTGYTVFVRPLLPDELGS